MSNFQSYFCNTVIPPTLTFAELKNAKKMPGHPSGNAPLTYAFDRNRNCFCFCDILFGRSLNFSKRIESLESFLNTCHAKYEEFVNTFWDLTETNQQFTAYELKRQVICGIATKS